MARQGQAGAAGQHTQLFTQFGLQPRAQAVHAQPAQARRRQFDGQRHAVELAADGHHTIDVGLGEHELRVAGLGAGFKERHRAGLAGALHGVDVGFAGSVCRRCGQWPQPHTLFLRQLQRHLAGGQQVQARRTRQQGAGQCGHAVGQVFAVVQHQQAAAGGQGGGQRFRAHRRRRRQAECGRHRHGDQRRVDQGCQLGHHGAVGQGGAELVGQRARQARLANAGRAQQGDHRLRQHGLAQ